MNELTQYGFPGIAVIGLAGFIMYLMKIHREERAEFRKTIEQQFDDVNKNTKENTSVLSALKTMLENRK